MNEEEKLESQAGPRMEWAAGMCPGAVWRERLSWLSSVDEFHGSCQFLPLPSRLVLCDSVRNCITCKPPAAG